MHVFLIGLVILLLERMYHRARKYAHIFIKMRKSINANALHFK